MLTNNSCGGDLCRFFSLPQKLQVLEFCLLFLLGFFWYRTLKITDVLAIFRESLHSTCMILLLIAGSMVLGHAITTMQISDQLVKIISDYDVSLFVFIILIMLLLFILGCILEVVSVIYIVVPILFPVVEALGIDAIWFAIIFIVNMEIALITPPLGMNLLRYKWHCKKTNSRNNGW